MYVDRPMKEYLDDLAARKPAPGGGSAAALAAAMGASLMSMVAAYTVNRPRDKAAGAKAAEILAKVQVYCKELRELIDEDAAAYERLTKEMKKCGDDTAKKDELYKDAGKPPFLVCELAHKCLLLCKELAQCGNGNLVTDTAIAAIMLEGAFFSSKFNVYINLACVKDTDYIAKIHKVLHPLEEKMPKLKEEVLEICEDVISK